MSKPQKSGSKPQADKSKGTIFVTEYKHWRSGKIMRASDYGLKAWPIGKKS